MVLLGLYRGYIGIMENKLEIIDYRGYVGLYMSLTWRSYLGDCPLRDGERRFRVDRGLGSEFGI